MQNHLMKEFGALALATLKEALTPFGFKRESKKIEQHFCNIVFVNGDRYVKLTASIHPRDFPPCFNIVLGEGPRDFFESE